jgi:hypothetical protein
LVERGRGVRKTELTNTLSSRKNTANVLPLALLALTLMRAGTATQSVVTLIVNNLPLKGPGGSIEEKETRLNQPGWK